MDRRRLVSLSVNGMALMIAGTVVVPAIINALSPALVSHHDPDWREVDKLDAFSVGSVHTLTVGERGIFVWRPSEEELVVFSRACTDLGCPLTWDSGSTWFFCPCHGGIFNQEGTPVAGPPSHPLWRYAQRIRNGILQIDMRSVPPMA